ncbi:MAG TPA: hypothetical protein VGP07_01185 [Polyangia bacterium]|jgi:hypothetical protein
MRRLAGIGFLVLGVTAAAPAVRAQVPIRAQADESREHLLAVGLKAGLLPPILTVVEVVTRPRPKLALGLFGMYTSGVGLGNGAGRTSLGGELGIEFRGGRRNTPYVSFAYDYYHASPDANGGWETSQTAYLTAGYLWKARSVELYVGGGLFILLADDLPPCTGLCLNRNTSPLLPTLELGVRFAFL